MNRIKQLRNENGITQRELAKLLGIEISAVSKLEVGRVPLKEEYIIKLASFFNVSTNYLLGIETATKRLLPVLGVVKAGYNYLAEQNIIDYINPYMENVDSENFFALLVKGDSMFPHFNDGDYVVVRKTDGCFESGKICVVLIDDEEATIKKVVKTEEGIELHAFNPYYPVRKYSFKEIKDLKIIILGVVEHQIRNWK
jgi:repressor LexA